MSYNDVLNYSIGIMEFLYKNGFDDLVQGLYYPGSGEIDISKKVSILIQKYTSKKFTQAKNEILADHTHWRSIVFAANEPNFIVDDDYKISHCDKHIHFLKKPLDKKYYRCLFDVIISDFNHSDIEYYYRHDYENINIIFFFFQGYLAYQWYRQYKLYKPFDTFTYKFSSPSRIIDKMRSYRLYLTSKFAEYDLLDEGQVSCSWSCPDTENTVPEILQDRYCFLNLPQRVHVKEHLLDKLPLRFDKPEHDIIPNTSYEIDWHTMGQSFLHVVNETVFFENFIHLTEKTFKPIVCQRPFIITSTPGALAFLKRYGFKTFDKWIDESYDNEPNHHKRLDMIAEQVRKICSCSIEELHQMYQEMKPILEHNWNIFFNELEDKVLQELLENYQS